jgi:hypothetical protein
MITNYLSALWTTIAPAAWLRGFLVILFVWSARWRRIAVAIWDAKPLREGHEVEALRRLDHTGGIQKKIELILSRASMEYGAWKIRHSPARSGMAARHFRTPGILRIRFLAPAI